MRSLVELVGPGRTVPAGRAEPGPVIGIFGLALGVVIQHTSGGQRSIRTEGPGSRPTAQWVGDVVVGGGLQTGDHVDGVGACGHDDGRQITTAARACWVKQSPVRGLQKRQTRALLAPASIWERPRRTRSASNRFAACRGPEGTRCHRGLAGRDRRPGQHLALSARHPRRRAAVDPARAPGQLGYAHPRLGALTRGGRELLCTATLRRTAGSRPLEADGHRGPLMAGRRVSRPAAWSAPAAPPS